LTTNVIFQKKATYVPIEIHFHHIPQQYPTAGHFLHTPIRKVVLTTPSSKNAQLRLTCAAVKKIQLISFPLQEWLHSARLHFPVSGMSISRTLFFIPARIPPDSLGYLFFPEEFFYRNLLLAGLRNPELLRNHRNTPEFLFPPTKTTMI
jgi:hypothetical protein